jgi:hypothetical protein
VVKNQEAGILVKEVVERGDLVLSRVTTGNHFPKVDQRQDDSESDRQDRERAIVSVIK